jgi:hypothetical protein
MRRASSSVPALGARRRPPRRLLAIAAALVLAGAFAGGVLAAGGGATIAAPKIALPRGFAPVAQYGSLVRDYRFDGSSLPADWSVGSGTHGFDSTIFAPAQVDLGGSAVVLHASFPTFHDGPWQGAWISTAGHFTLTHGLIEFRARMPSGTGLWSGLWADNSTAHRVQTEIDVVEMLLGNTHKVYGSLHQWSPTTWQAVNSATLPDDAASGFHNYELIWQPGMVTWAVDGRAYAQYTRAQARASGHPWPFDSARGVYLIADLAVGSTADWAGPPDAATHFPAAMEVRWVRVWQ